MQDIGYVILFLLFGVLVFDGCAGQGKQERWERCAEEIDFSLLLSRRGCDRCGYEQYRKCIDES